MTKQPNIAFTVSLSNWRCGKHGEHALGNGMTRLKNEDGYMCCLGFACEQLASRQARTLIGCGCMTEPSELGEIIPGLTRARGGCSK